MTSSREREKYTPHHDSGWAEITQICSDVCDNALQDESTARAADEQNHPPAHGAVALNPNATKYGEDMRAALETAESMFLPGGEVDQYIAALENANTDLECIEHTVDDIISSLQNRYLSLTDTAQEISQLRGSIHAVRTAENHITAFSEQLSIQPDLQETLQAANPHSQQFKVALRTLSTKLAFVHLEANAQSESCMRAGERLAELRDIALRRVKDRLALSLQLLKDPSSNFDILRDTLLRKQRALVEFAIDHDHAFGETVSREYVHLSSAVVSSSIEDYCKLLSSRPTAGRGSETRHGLSSLAQGTAGILSDILAETWTGPSPKCAETTSTVPDHDSRGFDGHQSITQTKDRLDDAKEKWAAASRRMTVPSLSAAEIVLQHQAFQPVLEEVLHNCTMFLLENVEKESVFLEDTFGEGTSHLLEDIFEGSQAPILSLLGQEIGSITAEASGLVSLLVALLVSRWHRTKIITHKSLDSRIKYLVETEKMFQTELLARLDSEIDSVTSGPDFWSEPTRLYIGYSSWVIQCSESVLAVFTISSKACTEIKAPDIFETVNRRTHSFIREMTTEIASFTSPSDGRQKTGDEARISALASLLSALELSTSCAHSTDALRTLREPVLVLFNETCALHARNVVCRHSYELTEIEVNVNSEGVDKMKTVLSMFYSNWEQTVQAVSDDYIFMEGHLICQKYCHIARNFAFNVLSDRNDQIASLIRLHSPENAHLIVPKAALLHLINSFN